MIVILLPAYDEADGIGSLLDKIRATMDRHGTPYRVLAVNDGSRDGTLGLLKRYAAEMPLEIINHRINRGLWETIRDGFEWAAENCDPDDIAVRMDADDRHDPTYIPALIQKLEAGY